MSKIRVIAIEKVISSKYDEREQVIACVYKDQKLLVYDTFGEMYYQKEYFENFNSINYFVKKGKYDWSDFYIEKGDIISRNGMGEVFVNGHELYDKITPLSNRENNISGITLTLYYNYLCKVNKGNPEIVDEIRKDFGSGEFKDAIIESIQKTPIDCQTNGDCEFTIRTRLGGVEYVSEWFKSVIASDDPFKFEQITYTFTRLFKLEYENYIEFH